jgi:hypothetical protein
MKQKIGNGFVWISVDETTDKMGRYVCNLLIGKMTEECFHQPQLIAAKILENTNFSTVSRMVNNELSMDFFIKIKFQRKFRRIWNSRRASFTFIVRCSAIYVEGRTSTSSFLSESHSFNLHCSRLKPGFRTIEI